MLQNTYLAVPEAQLFIPANGGNNLIKSRENLTEVLVPIHTRYGVFMGKRLKNLNGDDLTDKTMSAIESVLPTWTSINRTNIFNNNLEIIFNHSYGSLLREDLDKRIGNVKLPHLDTKHITKFKSKDGKYGISIPIIRNPIPNEQEFAKRKDAVKYFMSDILDDYEDNLSDKSRLALYAYTSGLDAYSSELNKFFRGFSKNNKSKFTKGELKPIKELSSHLDKAIAGFVLPTPIVTYRVARAFNKDNAQNMLDILTDCYKKNKPFVERGYCSTSVVKGSFTIPDSPQIHMKIHVPKGKGIGVYVSPFSDFDDEQEFLLARGTVFDVIHIQNNGNTVEVELRVRGRQKLPWKDYVENNSNIDLNDKTPAKPLDWEEIERAYMGEDDETWGEYAEKQSSKDKEDKEELESTHSNPLLDKYSPNYFDVDAWRDNLYIEYKTKHNKTIPTLLLDKLTVQMLVKRGYDPKDIEEYMTKPGSILEAHNFDPSWLK